MTTTPSATSTPGLALIAVAAATAGFMATALSSTAPATETDPIEPGQAILVSSAGEIRLTAPSNDTTQVLVFDPDSSYRDQLSVGPDEPSTLTPSQPTILLVPRHGATVQLHAPTADANPVPTRTALHGLVSADGPTDETITLTLHRSPDSLSLRVDGHAEDLEATVETSQGTVLHRDPDTASSSAQLSPELVTNGTYRVTVTADDLEGELQLVPRYLAHDEPAEPLQAPDAVDRQGSVLARVQAGDAWLIPERDELALALERGARADVRLYTADHRVLDRLAIGEEGPNWQWSNASGQAYHVIPIEERDVAAVYVDRVQADTDATVYVLTPEEDVMPGRPAEVRTTSVTVSYPSPSGSEHAQARYLGGLVDVRLAEARGAAAERHIAVEGPDGLLLDRYDRATGDDARPAGDEVRNVDSFGPGPVEITVEAEAASGSIRLELDHYVP